MKRKRNYNETDIYFSEVMGLDREQGEGRREKQVQELKETMQSGREYMNMGGASLKAPVPCQS